LKVHGNNFSDSFGGTSFTWQVIAMSGAASSSAQSAKPGSGYSYPATGAYEIKPVAQKASTSCSGC